MIVVDASVVADILLLPPGLKAIQAQLATFGDDLHAPHLMDVEVSHAVRRQTIGGLVRPDVGRRALADLADFPIRRYPHVDLLERVWELRDNLSAYDAIYVALAEALGMPLLTRDRRIAAAPGHNARIELI